jgi:hypothetical protein
MTRALPDDSWEALARRDKATKIHVALVKARETGLAITIEQVKVASKETRELLAKAAGVRCPSEATMQLVAGLMERYDCSCDPFREIDGNEDRTVFCVVHPKAHLKIVPPPFDDRARAIAAGAYDWSDMEGTS